MTKATSLISIFFPIVRYDATKSEQNTIFIIIIIVVLMRTMPFLPALPPPMSLFPPSLSSELTGQVSKVR